MSLHPTMATLAAAVLFSGAVQAQSYIRPGSPLERVLGVQLDEEQEVEEKSPGADDPSESKDTTAKAPPVTQGHVGTWSPDRTMWGLGAANSNHWKDSLIGQQTFGSVASPDSGGSETDPNGLPDGLLPGETSSDGEQSAAGAASGPSLPGLGSGYASGYASGYSSEYSSNYGASSPYWSATEQRNGGGFRRY